MPPTITPSSAARALRAIPSETRSEASRANGRQGGRPAGPQHIPAPGKSAGLRGTALCGRYARYQTGDHDQIRRLALAAVAEGQAAYYCARCLARLSQ
jgi:hypothetical protein